MVLQNIYFKTKQIKYRKSDKKLLGRLGLLEHKKLIKRYTYIKKQA